MAKQSHQNRLAKARNGEIMVEQNMAYDDSLLPNAEELQKLQEIDGAIVPWIMQRTEVEQNARIEFNKDRIRLSEYDLKRTHGFNFTALTYGFCIFVAVMVLSAFLVYKDLPIQGTIFGGTAIIGGAVFFVKASSQKKTQK